MIYKIELLIPQIFNRESVITNLYRLWSYYENYSEDANNKNNHM